MNNILVVHTSWYKEQIKSMIDISQGILSTDFNIDLLCAPGVIELPALAKHKILKREGSDQEQYLGVLFLGIVVRGETTHYENNSWPNPAGVSPSAQKRRLRS